MKQLLLIGLLALVGCTRNVDYVKAHAAERWKEMGYEIIAYEGYKWSAFAGGDVWYSLRNPETPGIIYTGFLEKWGDELHVYGPTPVNPFPSTAKVTQ